MLYIFSFLKENLLRNSSDIQREIPIKSTNPFLYEYWKVFSYLYFKKISDKFIQTNSSKFPSNLLNLISMNNLMQTPENYSLTLNEKGNESDKEIKKDSISLNGLNSVNNKFFNSKNSSMIYGTNNDQNFINQNFKEFRPVGFQNQPQNNFQNYFNPVFQNYSTNSANNNIFPFQKPQKFQNINNLNLNPIFATQNLINQKNFVNDLNPTNYLNNVNNYTKGENKKNNPYFQLLVPNPVLPSIRNNFIPSNNIIASPIPNNFNLSNNNNNLTQNQKINLNPITNNNNLNNTLKNDKQINLIKKSNINDLNNGKDKIQNVTKNNNLTNNIKINLKEAKKEPIISVKKVEPSTNKPPVPKAVPKFRKIIFSIKESTPSKDGNLLSKKRKRFIKNNKLVFVQMEENELNMKNEKAFDEDNTIEFNKNTKPRGSRYRGVSKNGSQWQVLIMVKKKKRYLGSFSNEEEAARAYDKVALQHHGNKAKTNYDYTKEEIDKILKGPKLLKVE